jgi:hypothetical protein
MAANEGGEEAVSEISGSSSRKRKLMVLLMMQLVDDDTPIAVERRVWTRDWILRREERGAYHTICKELTVEDTLCFSEYMRMPHEKFVALVQAIGPLLTKQETHMRKSIEPNERLALAIRYVATGETFQSLFFQFRIGKSTISQIVMEVCDAINQVLGNQHLKTPNTVEKWHDIADLFYSKWNIPNNIGAINRWQTDSYTEARRIWFPLS